MGNEESQIAGNAPKAATTPTCSDQEQGDAVDLITFLKNFYLKWVDCESTRGCYSCAPSHDCRCPKDRDIGECQCGRDELEALEIEILKRWTPVLTRSESKAAALDADHEEKGNA